MRLVVNRAFGILFLGGFGAVYWHGVNLRMSKTNLERLRQSWQRKAPAETN